METRVHVDFKLYATSSALSNSNLLLAYTQVRDCLIALQKLADMAEVLEAREKKLVELSRSNMDLTETNNILRK